MEPNLQFFIMNTKPLLTIAVILTLLLYAPALAAQSGQIQNINRGGKLEDWRVREIKESGIIGGNIKYLYEIAPGDTIKGNTPYTNPDGWVWSTSNVLAVVKGVTKTSCSVFPEKRGDGYCARLETRLEKVKVMGLFNMEVLTSGTIFLGAMLEPIKDTKNPQAKLNAGIPFTERPQGVQFDYKVQLGDNRIKASGFGSPKEIGDSDYAECVVILQKRTEDADGNITAQRVGTGYLRLTESNPEWTDGYLLEIHYGDITGEPFYKPYMQLIPKELSNYAINSKGKSVPIVETGWAGKEEMPTHLIIRFSSSYGEAYVGDLKNRLWIDNIKIVL